MSKRVKREEINFIKEKIHLHSPEVELQSVTFYHIPQFASLRGFVDFFDCIPELSVWLKKIQNWPEPQKGHILLVIHGLMKVGKTAVLKLIPHILPNYFAHFQCCFISFEMFPKTSVFDFLKRFYYHLGTWMFDTFRYSIPILIGGESVETFKQAIERMLTTISKNYEGHVFYLFDDVQRWFQLLNADLDPSVVNFFKNMVGNYPKQYFVITGNGMATTWSVFLETSTEDGFGKSIFSFEIPSICHRSTMEWCGTKLKTQELVSYAKNPAQLIFLNLKLLNSKKNPSNVKELEHFIQTEVDTKYIEEFLQDVFPLIQKSTPTVRQHLRRLALGISTEPPKDNWKYYLNNFANSYTPVTGFKLIQWNTETNNAPLDPNIKHFIGLKSSLFSIFLSIFINSDGKINECSITEWNEYKCLPLLLYHNNIVDDVSNIGSLCDSIEALWLGKEFEDSKTKSNCHTLERVCKSLFFTHNYILDINSYSHHQWFQLVLNYAQKKFQLDEKQNAFQKFMQNIIETKDTKFDYWYCTLFKLTRIYCFSQMHDLVARKLIVEVFPPWIIELVNQLTKEISFLHTTITP